MEPNMQFGRFVRKHRIQKHLTMEQMAELCDLSVRGYSDIEFGQSNPKLSSVVKIAIALDLDMNRFIEMVNSQKNRPYGISEDDSSVLIFDWTPVIYRLVSRHRSTFISHGIVHNKNARSAVAFGKA